MATEIKYKNLWFHPETPQQVKDALEAAYATNKAVRIWLGDVKTGRAWHEENDVKGRIGRSTGSIKIPLLIEPRQTGGCAILTHCIVRIDVISNERAMFPREARTVYRHQSFHAGDWSIKPSSIKGYAEEAWDKDVVIARFKQQGEAKRYISFMQGQSYLPA